MILIIGAMNTETETIKAVMTDTRLTEIPGLDAVMGRIYGKQVILCRCGIGKVYSAAATAAIAAKYNLSEIINVGVAGGIGQNVKKLDIVIAEKTVQHDFDLTCVGLKPGELGGGHSGVFYSCKKITQDLLRFAQKYTACHVGVIASGDKFVALDSDCAAIRNRFDALACDMESAAIALVADKFSVPFASMRCISDGANSDAVEDFDVFERRAADLSAKVLLEYIQSR